MSGAIYAPWTPIDDDLQSELIHARDDAASAAARKDEMLAHVVHELRTPLHAVLGFAQLLEWENDTLSVDQARFVHEISRASTYLLGLVNGVLDLQRFEHGVLAFNVDDVDIKLIVQETFSLLTEQARAQSVSLLVVPPASPVLCRADRLRLGQILINLVANAIKFNRPGGTVELRWAQAEGRMALIEVIDDGIGIPAEDIERIFMPFERLESAGCAVEGAGIGLAVSRQLVEAMGGTVVAESRLGRGTTLSVMLPTS